MNVRIVESLNGLILECLRTWMYKSLDLSMFECSNTRTIKFLNVAVSKCLSMLIKVLETWNYHTTSFDKLIFESYMIWAFGILDDKTHLKIQILDWFNYRFFSAWTVWMIDCLSDQI